jgi:crotonobetainyl-CoA:carnitine CoA-transferase CaiB-like acyl-CoA transferase
MANRVRSAEKESFWRWHVDMQAASELTVRGYCRRHRLSEPSFYAWRRELLKRDEHASAEDAHQDAQSGMVRRKSASRSRSAPVPCSQMSTVSEVARSAGLIAVDVISDVIHSENAAQMLEIECPGGVVIRLRESADADVVRRVITACLQSRAAASEFFMTRSGEVTSC